MVLHQIIPSSASLVPVFVLSPKRSKTRPSLVILRVNQGKKIYFIDMFHWITTHCLREKCAWRQSPTRCICFHTETMTDVGNKGEKTLLKEAASLGLQQIDLYICFHVRRSMGDTRSMLEEKRTTVGEEVSPGL